MKLPTLHPFKGKMKLQTVHPFKGKMKLQTLHPFKGKGISLPSLWERGRG